MFVSASTFIWLGELVITKASFAGSFGLFLQLSSLCTHAHVMFICIRNSEPHILPAVFGLLRGPFSRRVGVNQRRSLAGRVDVN